MIFRRSNQFFSRSGLIIFCLMLSLLSAACGEKNVAFADNEFEANQMFDILHSKGFQVDKKKPEGDAKTWEIVVDEGWFGDGEAATAIQVLRDYGLPRPPEPELKSVEE
jgi:type III secretory pathway lipoprotein EscJ